MSNKDEKSENTATGFKSLFRDENVYNEKTIIGFISFTIMTIFAITDIITSFMGTPLVVNDFIYNSFVIVTLGSFGIAEAGKVFLNVRQK